jgi:hypothetical protein
MSGEEGITRGELIDQLRLQQAQLLPEAIVALRAEGWIDERDRRLYLRKRPS